MSAPGTPSIPGYRIEKCLGAGGMGQVYLARQESLDRLVALKLLSPRFARDPAFVERFFKEARSAGKLHHENVIAAVDVGESGGQYYFVMEYVPGRPLSEVLKEESPIPERRALELVRQIARGLSHAHAQGFIHRDIKPANILLTPEGVAKICDLGLAREIGADASSEEGVMHGTPAYASPEQCRGAKDVDHRSDLYSLGVTAFEMLTGRRPFQGGSSRELARKQISDEPPSPCSINPSLSPTAGALVLRLLRKSPDERYADCEELLGAIEQTLNPPAARPAPPPRRPHPPPSASSRSGLTAVLTAGVLLGLATAFFLGGPQLSRPGAPSLESGDFKIEGLLDEAVRIEQASKGRPAEYAGVLRRWKELEEAFRGTPYHARFADRLLAFERSAAAEAEDLGRALLREAEESVRADHLLEALSRLGQFPEGLRFTRAAESVQAKAEEIRRVLDERFARDLRSVRDLAASERFGEARNRIEGLRSTLLFANSPAPKGQASNYENQLTEVLRQVEEKELVARARPPKEPDRNGGAAAPPSRPDPEGRPAAPPARAPAAPSLLAGFRQALEEGGPANLQVEAALLNANATKSLVYRAVALFLERGLAGSRMSGPVRAVLLNYLSGPPLDHPERLTLAEHGAAFNALVEAISASKDGGDEALIPFACAHLEGILSAGGEVDPALAGRARLKKGSSSGLWGPLPDLDRVEIARLLLKRQALGPGGNAPPPVSAPDFLSDYGRTLLLMKAPVFEVSAAIDRWRRLASGAPDAAWARMAESMVDRLRSLATCEACGGQGKYPCPACAGLGLSSCPTCSGVGSVTDDCGGKVTCTDCKGRGQAVCSGCSGAKLVKCSACDGKRATGSLPGGLAHFVLDLGRCDACSGQGSAFEHVLYACPRCAGIGRVMSEVPREFGRLPAWLKGRSGMACWNALGWLARHQSADGSWKASGWASSCQEPACEKTPAGPYDVGVTSLALLAFLGAGVARESDFRTGGVAQARVVERAIQSLLARQKPDGLLTSPDSDKPILEHLLGLFALASAEAQALGAGQSAGRPGPTPLRQGVQRALRAALDLQGKGAGWSYSPEIPTSDTWVTSWGGLALLAAKDAGLEVPRIHLEWVLRWLDGVTDRNDLHVGEAPDRMGKVDLENTEDFLHHETLGAAAGLLRLLIQGKSGPWAPAATKSLMKDLPGHDPLARDFSYWHWGTSLLAQRDGRRGALWSQWSLGVDRELLPLQETGDTCALGSWAPKDRWGEHGGTVYATALSTLTLEVVSGIKPLQKQR